MHMTKVTPNIPIPTNWVFDLIKVVNAQECVRFSNPFQYVKKSMNS